MKRYIRCAVKSDVDLDNADYKLLLDLASDSADPKLLRDILAKDSDNDFLRDLVVSNPRAPEDLVLPLVQDGYPKDPNYRRQLADEATNPKILAALVDMSDAYTRQTILTNVHTPIDVVLRLFYDSTIYDDFAYNLVAINRSDELSDEELIRMYKSGKISRNCESIVRDKIFDRGLRDSI